MSVGLVLRLVVWCMAGGAVVSSLPFSFICSGRGQRLRVSTIRCATIRFATIRCATKTVGLAFEVAASM